jgi:hypothetical protein
MAHSGGQSGGVLRLRPLKGSTVDAQLQRRVQIALFTGKYGSQSSVSTAE